ncbi:MAG: ABC transporter ATP-binding protein [Anaerolineae bacterium]|nr:ABC transporter ATP-binding protein [Anaerolineae bacterium]
MPPINDDALLRATNISRAYGPHLALKPTDLELRPGQMVAVRGPNGSGKTTLLLCLAGLLRPGTGSVSVQGHDLYRDEPEARRALAFVPDVPVFYDELTAWEHLRFVCLAHGVEQGFEERARDLLWQLGLWEARDLFPRAYSRGMRQKLALALALIRPSQVLLMDEPTSGLDPESTELLCHILHDFAHDGGAVLLSSHDPGLPQRLPAATWTMREGSLVTQ